jgi:hypothetical protein
VRNALRLVLGLVAANAALAIGVLLLGGWGDTQANVLVTSVVVTVGVVQALACAPSARAGGRPWLRSAAALSLGTGVAGGGLLLWVLWAGGSSSLERTMSSLLITMALATLITLLAAGTGPRRLLAADAALAAVLDALLIAAVWSDWDGGWYWRLTGVAAVLVAALSVAVAVLRASARPRPAAEAPAVRFCPSCGRSLEAARPGECAACGARFSVTFAAPQAERLEPPDASGEAAGRRPAHASR